MSRTADTDPPRQHPRRAGMQWPALVVGMLVLNMGICAVTIVAAVRTNPAVVPDYYQKALDWDEHRPDADARRGASNPASQRTSPDPRQTATDDGARP